MCDPAEHRPAGSRSHFEASEKELCGGKNIDPQSCFCSLGFFPEYPANVL